MEGWPTVFAIDGKPIDRGYFCSEGCGTFALVLAQRFSAAGKRAVLTIASRQDGQRWSDAFSAEVTHVLVRTEQGYWDVNGHAGCVREALVRANLTHRTEGFSQVDYEAEVFEGRFMGEDDKPLYGRDSETEAWAEALINATPERFA